MLKLSRIFFIICFFFILIGGVKHISKMKISAEDQQELNVFVWGDFLNQEMVECFENEKGVKVNLHFYNSNEELLRKLEVNTAKSYDILFPSDYACKILIKRGYLEKLNKEKLPIFNKIYPFLLNQDYDKKNIYSIPYMWESYGFAYNPELIVKTDFSIKDLFYGTTQRVMTPDGIETINFAVNCLFDNSSSLTENEENQVIQLLLKQKKYVEAYTEFRGKNLITSKNVPFGLLKTTYITELKNENPLIKYTLPNDKIFTSIENAVICKDSKNMDHAYNFLNYIFQPKKMAKAVSKCPLYPAREDINISPSKTGQHQIFIDTLEEIKKRPDDIYLFSHITDSYTTRHIIIRTKS